MKSVTRLIELFAPEHYELSIKLYRPERRFGGTVTIHGITAPGANEVRLHARGLSITTALVDGKEASTRIAKNDEIIISHPDIARGDHHVIVVQFNGTITDDMNGIYPCYYEVDSKKQELLATQFESHYARRAFPCVDEPEAKATFDITLSTEKNVVVLGNMPVKWQREEDDTWLVTRFETTPRMSSYLIAWVVGDLQKQSTKTKSGVEVSVWATKAQKPASLQFATTIAARVIDFFNEYFGVSYPLPKSDHVALPDFSAGAMENWGLITYREIALLVDEDTTSLAMKHYVATVVAHELSHQWFGNLVTMKWWNDLWLNESFADMMEYLAIDALEPSWNVWLDFATSDIISALRRDALDGVQPIQIDVTHPDEISTIFDPSIVYAKGGRLLRMLQSYVGEDAFRAGLKNYFQAHAYSNTSADDLWEALSAASNKDIASFMHSWMTQPGYPIVSARQEQNGEIVLSQEQFFIGPHQSQTPKRLWPIPLHANNSFTPNILAKATLMVAAPNQDSSKKLSTTGSPFMLNSGASAHFITAYDDTLRTAIIENIGQLSSLDKLEFLNEQLLIAKSGRQSYATILPILQHFKNETNESVWDIVALAINELKRFIEDDRDAEAALKHLVADTVATQLKRLGWKKIANEDENDTKLRSTIISLALYAEIPKVCQEAERLYSKLSIDELNPELRTSIMAHVVRRATSKTASAAITKKLLAIYTSTSSSELRDDITSALAATHQTDIIAYLSGILKDTAIVRPQDFSYWFVRLLQNRYAKTHMWQWARDNWSWIEATFKEDASYDALPRYIASALRTSEQYLQYKTFFKPLEENLTLVRNIRIGYTELEGTVTLLERDGVTVRDALRHLY